MSRLPSPLNSSLLQLASSSMLRWSWIRTDTFRRLPQARSSLSSTQAMHPREDVACTAPQSVSILCVSFADASSPPNGVVVPQEPTRKRPCYISPFLMKLALVSATHAASSGPKSKRLPRRRTNNRANHSSRRRHSPCHNRLRNKTRPVSTNNNHNLCKYAKARGRVRVLPRNGIGYFL